MPTEMLDGMVLQSTLPLPGTRDQNLRESRVGGRREVEGGGGPPELARKERKEGGYPSWARLRGGARTFLPSGGLGIP